MEAQQAGLFAGKYRDLKEISRRPWRLTYSATDITTNLPVFIKVMGEQAGESEADIQYFFAEPQLLVLLNRQLPEGMLTPVLDMGVWEGKPFFVQPFLEGWPLQKTMVKRAAFIGEGIIKLLDKCLRILESLHNAGYAHGDLSPENIFIITKDPVRTDGILPDEFDVKLVDFEGTKKFTGAEANAVGKMTFKIPYLAPELAGINPVINPKSDLYAMGIILFEMLTGSRPYPVDKLEDLKKLTSFSLGAIPLIFGIPQLMEDFVRRLIAIDPEKRFPSAPECLDRLRQFVALQDWLDKTHPVDLSLIRIGRADLRPEVSSVVVDKVITRLDTHIRSDQMEFRKKSTQVTNPEIISDRPSQDSRTADRAEVTTGCLAPEESERKELSTTLDVPFIAETGKQELVDFSVFGPDCVFPGASFILDVWAYGAAQRDEMLGRARRNDRIEERGSRGGIQIPTLTELTLFLELDRFEVEDPAEPFFWKGFVTNVSFIIRAPGSLPPGLYPGRLKILKQGLLLSKLFFEIAVADAASAKKSAGSREIRATEQKVRTAFASYSSKDRDQVTMCVKGMSHAGLDVFMDVLDLRAGDDWEDRIHQAIQKKDMFFLFWSDSARNSTEVEKEWRFALQEKGLEFIHPVPLADPRLVPPPAELARLHFNDIFLMCLNYAKNLS